MNTHIISVYYTLSQYKLQAMPLNLTYRHNSAEGEAK